MNQTFDLKNMGFSEMEQSELEVLDGGVNWWGVAAIGLSIVAGVCTGGMSLAAEGMMVCCAGLAAN